MNNSIKLPIAALSVALLLSVFTFGSIVARGGGEGGASTEAGGNVPNGQYGGNRFWSDVTAQQVTVAADPSGALRWDQAEYTAPAGDVTFVVKNPSPVQHQFGIEGNGINYQSGNISGGNTTTNLTLRGLPAGEYQIVCNFPGHKEGGMVAKLIVT
jgi:plastocyanin